MGEAPGRVGPEVLHDFDEATKWEWLVTNGLGGYGSSTVVGANTRRYHGLLVAALRPPRGRHLLLAKLEEEVELGDMTYLLSVNQYPGVLHPQGHLLMEAFDLLPWPRVTYRLGPALLMKEVVMPRGRNAVAVRYLLRGVPGARLTLRPLLDYRSHHGETRERSDWTWVQRGLPGGVEVAAYEGATSLRLSMDDASYTPSGRWYYNLIHHQEAERGLPDRDDHFNPGAFVVELEEGREVVLRAAADDGPWAPTPGSMPRASSPWELLRSSAEAFLVEGQGGARASVVAGYPWFTDWGRDAMVSLPGLTLATGRMTFARQVLRAFAQRMEDGLIPNYFPDEGQEAEYNSVDGSLWFVNALGSHWRAYGDHDLVEELWPRVEEVAASYQGGTKFGIGLDDQGFVVLPRGPLALTWMDARVGGKPVTPRHGRPVEVQALWFNALRWAETMASHLGKRSPVEIDLAAFPREFKRAFWRPDLGYLLDTHSPDDPALRPNQLLALALPHPVFGSPAEAARVIAAVDSDLLTPLGLRTLSPRHPSYRGTYGGPPHERDEAYHNGTVWPWLLGPYGDVIARWGSRPPGWLDYLLGGLLEHAPGRGLGNLPELFSGDPPHRPGGCIAQAWSVAEVLRLRWRYGTGGNRAGGHGGAW